MLLGLILCPVDHPVDIGVCLHLRAVEIQLLSPYQSSFHTQFHNAFEESLEHFESKTFTNFTQAAVIGDWLIEVITDEPAVCQVEIDHLHYFSFRTDSFEKRDQLELEENHWINGCTSDVRVKLGGQFTDKTEINASFHLAIEIVLRYQIFQTDSNEWLELPDLVTQHVTPRNHVLLKKPLKLNILRKTIIVRRWSADSIDIIPYLKVPRAIICQCKIFV